MKPSLASRPRSLVLAAAITVAGCEGNPPPIAKPVVPAPAPVEAPAAPEPEHGMLPPAPSKVTVGPIGMSEPFKLMNGPGLRTLDLGWKALKAKDYDAARAAFHEVVAQYPDKPATRYAELRATVLGGDFAAVPALWRELLARDYVGYAGRLDRGKEMAGLRKSPHWSTVQAITAEMKKQHLAALAQGFFFVARLRPSEGPTFTGSEADGESIKLDVDQEVFHFDPVAERMTRISDEGGKVLGLHRDDERRQLMLVTASAIKKTGGKVAFVAPAAVIVSLDTLARTGPLPLAADAVALELCFSDQGEPIWGAVPAGNGDGKAFTLDATGKNLVASEVSCSPSLAVTSVKPSGVDHTRPMPEGVALSADGLRLTGVDEELTVRATSAIRPGSFGWSPGQKRFLYSGDVDRCTEGSNSDKEPTNALYVWSAEDKRALRVTTGKSSLVATFIDDDHLAFESGPGRATKLTVHDLAANGLPPLTLKVPAGAGLYGIPTLGCGEAEGLAFAQ